MPTSNIRDSAVAALRKLPPDATMEDLQYRLYVLEKIKNGEASLSDKGGVTHAEAKRRMKKWLSV